MRITRWLALALAIAGLVQTPFLIPEVISLASADHRMIPGYLVGFTVRFLFIGLFAKHWWDTRKSTYGARDDSQPRP